VWDAVHDTVLPEWRRLVISATEFVYAELHQRIMDGELQPGSKLVIEEVASQFGVSRTPVREALQKLSAEGLVVIAPRKYTRVSEISFDDLDKLYAVRQILEDLACKDIISNVSQSGIEQLEALLAEARLLLVRDDLTELRRVNRRFHGILYRATGNRYLEEVLLSLRGKSWRYIEPAIRAKKRMAQGLVNHAAICDALRRCDLHGLRKAVADDLAATVAMLRSSTQSDAEAVPASSLT
jgi:DNA-binding GntR family transcriptional regulator